MKVQRLDVETMKIEYNTSKSALPFSNGSEDIVRTIHITKMKVLNWRIKSLQDNTMSYNSDKDEWKMPVVATRKITIPQGTRICQFRIQLSQKATIWQKIKWLFSKKAKLEQVFSLENEERGGFGSTGTK